MPSSVIRSFRYDPADESLAIRFVSGRRYRYARVPKAIYEEMIRSSSKGAYFNEHIRDRFGFTLED
jgi:lysyl-tRNA synthetase class 2